MKVAIPTFECRRCGHRWYPRKPERPLRCAKCKSPYWGRPKAEEKACPPPA